MFPFDSDSLNFFFILQMEKYGGRPAQLVLYYHGFMGAEVTVLGAFYLQCVYADICTIARN